MNYALRQPTPARLDRWLEQSPAKFERYLALHPEVADRYEVNNPLSALREGMTRALDDARAVPFDLADRLHQRIVSMQHDTSASVVALDLLGLGTATLKLLAGLDGPSGEAN